MNFQQNYDEIYQAGMNLQRINITHSKAQDLINDAINDLEEAKERIEKAALIIGQEIKK